MVLIQPNQSNYNELKTCPTILNIRINLTNNNEYHLELPKGCLIKDTIYRFLTHNQIHYKYYSMVKSIVEEAIHAKIKDQVQNQQLNWVDNFTNLSENQLDELLDFTLNEFSTNLQLDKEPDQERFDILYQTLITVCSPEVFNKLLELELNYIKEVRKLDENWKIQYELIAEDHENELSNLKAQFNQETNFSNITLKHKQDIEMIQISWMNDVEDLKIKQIKENRELVKILHDALISEEVSKDFSKHLDIMKTIIGTKFHTKQKCSTVLLDLFKPIESDLTETKSTSRNDTPVNETSSNTLDPQMAQYIDQLKSMGFTDQEAECALSMTSYDFEEAVDLLLENPEKVSQQILINTNNSNPTSSPLLGAKFSLSKLASSSPPIFKNWGFKPFQSNIPSGLNSNNSNNNNSSNNSTPGNNFSSGAGNKLRDWIGKTVSDIWTEGNENKKGSNLSNNQHQALSESFTILLGNQIRIPFNLVLRVANLDDLLPPPSSDLTRELAMRTETLASLYTSHLRGLVVIVNPKQTHIYPRGTDINRVIFDHCRHTTEFHFDNFNDQLKNIYGLSQTEESTEFKEGDYFITKHSNLPMVHTVFHLVIDFSKGLIKDDFNQKSSLYTSLKNILATCYQHDIMDLTFPLGVNLPPTNPRSLEVFFKCLKGLLIDTARWPVQPLPDPHQLGANAKTEPNQRTLQLILPKNTQFEEFELIRNLLTSIFKTF